MQAEFYAVLTAICWAIGSLMEKTGIRLGHLTPVMTIAFCLAPVLGVILGVLVLKEKLNTLQMAGIALCIIGAAMTVYFKNPHQV